MSIFVMLERLEALLPPLDDPERIHNITGLGTVLGAVYARREKNVMPIIRKTILNKDLKLHNPKSRDTELISLAHALGANANFFANNMKNTTTLNYFVYFFNQLEDRTRAEEFITEKNQHFNKAELDSQINDTLAILKKQLAYAPLRAQQKVLNKDIKESSPPIEIFKFLNICLLTGCPIPYENDFLASLPQHWQEFEACHPVIIELISAFLLRKNSIEPSFLSKVISSTHWQEFINKISEERPQEYIALFGILKDIFSEEGTPPATCLPTTAPKEGVILTFLINQITSVLNPNSYIKGSPVIAFNRINDFMRRFLSWDIPINLPYSGYFIGALKTMTLDILYLEKMEYIFDKNPPLPFHSPSGLSVYEDTLGAIEKAWENSLTIRPDTAPKYLEYAEAFSRIEDLKHLVIDEKLIEKAITDKYGFIDALASLEEPLKTKLYSFIANDVSTKALLKIIEDITKEDPDAQNILNSINRKKNEG